VRVIQAGCPEGVVCSLASVVVALVVMNSSDTFDVVATVFGVMGDLRARTTGMRISSISHTNDAGQDDDKAGEGADCHDP
jgi:hypothetical protein